MLEPYIAAIKKRFNTMIAVEIDPPPTDAGIPLVYRRKDFLLYKGDDPESMAPLCSGHNSEIAPSNLCGSFVAVSPMDVYLWKKR